MNKFKFKRKNLIWQYLLGIFALTVGSISIFSDIKGLVPTFIGGYLLIEDGLEIDFDNKKYRTTKSFFGITFGRWIPLPDIEYVSIFKTKEVTTIWARSASANISNSVFKVNLFHNTNQKIKAYVTKDIDDAFKKAKEIASSLHIDILDATEQDSKWL